MTCSRLEHKNRGILKSPAIMSFVQWLQLWTCAGNLWLITEASKLFLWPEKVLHLENVGFDFLISLVKYGLRMK